ncbi:MAG: pitrilysin family protein [Planctomycetota bacterium]|nr:pitrilysin family protein [Planctomycetota bacterium]
MIHTRILDCGLTVLVEPIASVESCSIHWLVPAGTAYDPADRTGISTVLAELLLRGAGGRDSRRLSDDMDRIGLERDCGISQTHGWLVGSVLGNHLETSLALFTDVIRSPELPSEAVPACQSLVEQSIESLEDEPQHEVMLHVRRRHHCPPFNRSNYGFLDVIQSVSSEELRHAWKAGFVPEGSLLGLAGNVDPDTVSKRLEVLLSGWSGSRKEPEPQGVSQGGKGHLSRESSQLHLGMGWSGPIARDEDSILERLAVRILGGSTSGRLFTEVRQRRSLCYSVSAAYRARRDEGVVSLYAGTTPDRAAETLAVCEQEIDRLQEGVDEDELVRAKVGMKGTTVFGGERTQARAAALVSDQFALGEARSMPDRLKEIEEVDRDRLNAYLAARTKPERTIVAVGPEAPGDGFEAESPLCRRQVSQA